MTREDESWRLDTTPTPRRILDRLTLRVVLERNGKPIFTRRLLPSYVVDEGNRFYSEWNDTTGMVKLHVPNPAPSVRLQLRKLVSKK